MATINRFYCTADQSWLVIISTQVSSNTQLVCSINIQEVPDESRSKCSISLYEPDVADQLILESQITEGLLKETNKKVAKSIIRNFEKRNQELLTFCDL